LGNQQYRHQTCVDQSGKLASNRGTP
jgi:hypothetical protein